jgi:NAD(P)H-flavin reductase/NAD-dependent dihydropyrimidine dehydrogenase PreA subunit
MATFNIKANRVFTIIRKYGFIFTLTVAIGGLWLPKLGLLVIPVMLGLMLYSFFKGRYWCGNICAHGSLYDSLLIKITRNAKIPKFFKSKFLSIAFFSFFSYQLINKFIKVAGIYGSSSFFDKIGLIFVSSYLMVSILGGFLAIVVAPRTWCNFCPMGVLQKISYTLGRAIGVTKITDEKITVTKSEMCHKCGKCSRVCPMQLTPYTQFDDKNQFDEINCLKCSTCVEHCPAGILSLTNEKVAEILDDKVGLEGYENRERINSKIVSVIELQDDVVEYTFEFLDSKVVDYKAGQFILVKIQDNPEMFRAFSISSYNEDGRKLSVTIKKMLNGYGTDIIFNGFKVGDEVILEGPLGNELIVDKKAEKVVLVAGGIGITPFIPIVTDIVKSNNDIKNVKLIYGANKKDEFIYIDEFKALEKVSDKFDLVQVVAFDENWQGEKGFVTDYIKKMQDINESIIFMCGPPPMINASLKVLDELNVKKQNINYESA